MYIHICKVEKNSIQYIVFLDCISSETLPESSPPQQGATKNLNQNETKIASAQIAVTMRQAVEGSYEGKKPKHIAPKHFICKLFG